MYGWITEILKTTDVVQYQTDTALNIQHSIIDRLALHGLWMILLPPVFQCFRVNGISFLSNYCYFYRLSSLLVPPVLWALIGRSITEEGKKNPAVNYKITTTSTSGKKKKKNSNQQTNKHPFPTEWTWPRGVSLSGFARLQRTVYNLYLDMHMWIFWRSLDVFFFLFVFFLFIFSFFLMVCKSI